jgi:hypothetical protein
MVVGKGLDLAPGWVFLSVPHLSSLPEDALEPVQHACEG